MTADVKETRPWKFVSGLQQEFVSGLQVMDAYVADEIRVENENSNPYENTTHLTSEIMRSLQGNKSWVPAIKLRETEDGSVVLRVRQNIRIIQFG